MSAELTEMNDPQLWICSSRKDTASRRHWISNVSYSSHSYSPRQITHYQPYLLHLSLILIIFGTVSTKTNCNNYQSFYIIILSLLCMMVCNAQWIQINNPLLPRSDQDMISASYNGSIFLIGGSPDFQQMTEYIISDNIILDHGVSVLPLYHYCSGQCYTQFENILRIERRGEIIVYDVELTDFITNSVSILTPDGISYGGANCLLSNDVYLLMIGGYVTGKGAVDTVQVFILDENIWFNATSMPQNRINHGCILTSDFVYIMLFISGTPIKNKNEATLSVNGHTYAPTVSPLPEYERTTTTTDQENTDDNEDDVDKANVNQGLLLLIILLSVIITACCGITSFVYLNRNRILTTIAKYTRSRAADDNNNNNNINNDNVNPMCVQRAASVSFDALQICSNLGSNQNTLTQSTDNSTYKMGGVTNKQHMITAGVGSEGHVMSLMIPGKMMDNRGENAHNDAMYIEEGINRDHIVVPHHIAFVHAAVNDPVIEDENEETNSIYEYLE